MNGTNHVCANVCTVTLVTSCITYSEKFTPTLINAYDSVFNYIFDGDLSPVNVGAIILLFILGSLLPDIDSPESLVGRFIYLPFEHRTWTHTIWVVLILGLASIKYRLLAIVCLAYFLHLCFDSLSKCGVCWIYPISKYRKYGSHAKVKEGHKLHLYGSRNHGEYIIVGVLATLTIVCCILDLRNGVTSSLMIVALLSLPYSISAIWRLFFK